MDTIIWRLLDFLAVAEFSQAVLLVFILLVMERNRRANIFFAVFILILSSNFFSLYLMKADMKVVSSIFFLVAVPGISLTGVCIYFYAMFITGLLEGLRVKHILHLGVYLASLGVTVAAMLSIDGNPARAVLKDSVLFRNSIFTVISAGLLCSIGYIVYTLALLKRYYDRIGNYYSDIERMSLNWVRLLSAMSFLVLVFWCVGFWLGHLHVIPRSPAGMTINLIMLIAIIFVTAYRLINQPEIFKYNVEMTHEIEETDSQAGGEKYARQSIDDRMQDEYLEKLKQYMEGEKPYLNENITIKDLSEEIKIPSHHLSIVINNRLGKNFYTFINDYRIKEALSILNDPENSDASILAIAFRAGFNSKSTFNSVFKKITGKTPSEYRSTSGFRSELAS
ncbi:MAG TPA: AraC family transcriptional regulator [Spirochaetota bacterium]|nr:AraC family transcriptional regulator [Spirochaetota bacterium]